MFLVIEKRWECSHNYIGTEHILAGPLAVKGSTAGEILTEAGISLKKLLELMEKLVAPSSEVLLEEPQGYTPEAKILLKKSIWKKQQIWKVQKSAQPYF